MKAFLAHPGHSLPIVPSLGSWRTKKIITIQLTVPASNPADKIKLYFDHHRN